MVNALNFFSQDKLNKKYVKTNDFVVKFKSLPFTIHTSKNATG